MHGATIKISMELVLRFLYITSKYGQMNDFYLHLNCIFCKYCFRQDEILSWQLNRHLKMRPLHFWKRRKQNTL